MKRIPDWREKRGNTMDDYIVNVSGSGNWSAALIKGTKNILFDTGMAYAAGKMIENIRAQLGEKPLDAVLLSHSHYDHASGIPFVKREWPQAVVYGSEYAKRVFEKPSAQKVICEMSENAARQTGHPAPPAYRDDELRVDAVVHDGDVLAIGDHRIRVFETPGHTKCSLSFLVDDDLLFLSETFGVFDRRHYMPCYLVGYRMIFDSLEKLKAAPVKRLFVTHSGPYGTEDIPATFDRIREQLIQTKEQIVTILKTWPDDEERQLAAMAALYHDGIVLEEGQPRKAFLMNAAATLKLVRRECMEGAV